MICIKRGVYGNYFVFSTVHACSLHPVCGRRINDSVALCECVVVIHIGFVNWNFFTGTRFSQVICHNHIRVIKLRKQHIHIFCFVFVRHQFSCNRNCRTHTVLFLVYRFCVRNSIFACIKGKIIEHFSEYKSFFVIQLGIYFVFRT